MFTVLKIPSTTLENMVNGIPVATSLSDHPAKNLVPAHRKETFIVLFINGLAVDSKHIAWLPEILISFVIP